jgi:hypothetical protein
MTVLAILCDHSTLNGVTMGEVSSMPNVTKSLTLVSFVVFISVDTEKNMCFWQWDDLM